MQCHVHSRTKRDEAHTMALGDTAALVPAEGKGMAVHLSGASDSLQAAQHLLLPRMLATAGQGGLQNADVPTLTLTDDQGCVARH